MGTCFSEDDPLAVIMQDCTAVMRRCITESSLEIKSDTSVYCAPYQRLSLLQMHHARRWASILKPKVGCLGVDNVVVVTLAYMYARIHQDQVHGISPSDSEQSPIHAEMTHLLKTGVCSVSHFDRTCTSMPTLYMRLCASIVRSYPGDAAGMTSTSEGVTYNDIDMHASFENRVELKRNADLSDDVSSDQVLASLNDDKVDDVTLVKTATRLQRSIRSHLMVLSDHRIADGWRHSHDSMRSFLVTMMSHVSTSNTNNRARNVIIGRHLPMGSLSTALTHSHDEMSAVSVSAVARQELTDKGMIQLTATLETSRSSVLDGKFTSSLTDAKLVCNRQQEAWILTLWDRVMRSRFDINFMEDLVVQHFQIETMLSNCLLGNALKWGRPRCPMLLEVAGSWGVSVPLQQGLVYIPCVNLIQCLHVWCCTLHCQDRGPTTPCGKDLSSATGSCVSDADVSYGRDFLLRVTPVQ